MRDAGSSWLFSRSVDIAVFGGSAVLSVALLLFGVHLGILDDDLPAWTWILVILLLDVAHVWATMFRVYLDKDELARRPLLYGLTPVLIWIGGVVLYSEGRLLFWRVVAYLAVFHFVRQQYGWVMLYRRRAGQYAGYWLDALAIYSATIFPLLFWHAHLPRNFSWFVPGDFVAVSQVIWRLAAPLYPLILLAYAARSGYQWIARRRGNAGKDLVVASTAVCWYLGIVASNSDFAFTVTNVIIHGVPYFVLVYSFARQRWSAGRGGRGLAPLRYGPWAFFAVLWILAFAEELLWDRLVWHERSWLFGDPVFHEFHTFVVPLLAVPALTHYVLDGFIWRANAYSDVANLTTKAR